MGDFSHFHPGHKLLDEEQVQGSTVGLVAGSAIGLLASVALLDGGSLLLAALTGGASGLILGLAFANVGPVTHLDLRPRPSDDRSLGWLGFLGFIGISGFTTTPAAFALLAFFAYFRFFLPVRPQ